MSFEKPQFNKPEAAAENEKKMSPEAAKEMLGEMDEYTEGLMNVYNVFYLFVYYNS